MNKTLIIAILLLVIIGGAYFIYASNSEESPQKETNTPLAMPDMPKNETPKEEPTEVTEIPNTSVVVYSGQLVDVTEGNDINGFSTQGLASGSAEAYYSDDKYNLTATFSQLPELTEDFFYEGWVVLKGENLSVVSTGELELDENGVFTNIFEADQDLTDHSFYVLTLEPNDGDPAPAEHVVEGTLTEN